MVQYQTTSFDLDLGDGRRASGTLADYGLGNGDYWLEMALRACANEDLYALFLDWNAAAFRDLVTNPDGGMSSPIIMSLGFGATPIVDRPPIYIIGSLNRKYSLLVNGEVRVLKGTLSAPFGRSRREYDENKRSAENKYSQLFVNHDKSRFMSQEDFEKLLNGMPVGGVGMLNVTGPGGGECAGASATGGTGQRRLFLILKLDSIFVLYQGEQQSGIRTVTISDASLFIQKTENLLPSNPSMEFIQIDG